MRRRRSTRGFTRGRKNWNSRVYSYKRRAYFPNFINQSTITNVTGATSFALSGVPAYTEFTALYDVYKLTRVRIEFIPRYSAPELGSAASRRQFFTAIDYDDANSAGLDISTILERSSVKRTTNTSKHVRTLIPKVAKPIYQDGISTAYGPGRSWIDCAQAAVPHYGLKWVLENASNASSLMSYDAYVTYYVSFKNVH